MTNPNVDVSMGESMSHRNFDASLKSQKVKSLSSFAPKNQNEPQSHKATEQGYLSFNYKV